ncbi:hypothetical protein HDV05_004197 [Chytridiales sp. JEL 0842]|nr:hypothetical protein HDV05_004197 [Chytridiales sp. JEL 0842]
MKTKVLPEPTPVNTAINGATAGLALATLMLPQQTVALFPDQPSEFIKNLPRPSVPRVLFRGALGHAGFFTVYEGLMGSIVRARRLDSQIGSSSGTQSQSGGYAAGDPLDLTMFSTRFLAGGVSAIVYKAATMGLANGLERPEVPMLVNAKNIGRSFAMGGLVMAAGGVVEALLANK